jgi:ABC-2 type transport system permease protein
MTAIAIADAKGAATPSVAGRFLGLRPLLRKDRTEWMRGRRAWIVAGLTTLFMVLTAANGAINNYVRTNFPEPELAGTPLPSLDPATNLLAALGSQIFVVAAVFAVASLIVHERDTGTLAWVASKPVSRGSIWLSKWISSTAILAVAAGLVPLAITTGVVVALYGAVALSVLALILVGMIAAIAFFAAVGLAAGTVVPGQPAIVAVGLGVLFLVPVLAGLVPFDVTPYLPTSILDWSIGLAGGQDVGFITPIAWAIGTLAVVAFAIRRMERIEL